MAEERAILWRVAWRDGTIDRQFDHDTEDGANRHKVWLERGNEGLKWPVVAQVYAITVYVEESA